MLCAAIISDTLMFRSPTCTFLDKAAAEALPHSPTSPYSPALSVAIRNARDASTSALDDSQHMSHRLIGIRERTRIEHHENGIAFTEDDGATWTHLDDDTTVSMNMWGFSKSILDEIEKGFPAFLEKGLKENPMKCEYYLPGVVSDLLGENRATVAVLKSADKWYGVTYKEDKPVVMEAIRKMEEEGLYPA